jgi:Methionine biosynthesis protein MetW
VNEPGGARPADTDLDLVIAEIHAEAARLRRMNDGGLDDELDAAFRRHTPPDIDTASTAEAFAQLDALTAVSIPVPDSAPRPGRAEWKRTVLRVIGRILGAEVVARLVRMATSEITAFNAAVVRVLRRIEARLSVLESRVGEPTAAVRTATDQAVPPPARVETVDAVTGVLGAPGGRVLHVGCGRGELVRALTEAGVGAYGVDTRRGLHVEALRDGLDVRGDEPAAHLAALPARALGAVVLDGTLDSRSVDEQVAMLDDAVRATARGGRVVVVLSERHGAAAVAADLSGGHPLLPATWHHLLSLRTTVVREVDAGGIALIVGDIGP